MKKQILLSAVLACISVFSAAAKLPAGEQALPGHHHRDHRQLRHLHPAQHAGEPGRDRPLLLQPAGAARREPAPAGLS